LLNVIFQKKYIIYGSSIIATRALEYVVLFFAASYLAKEEYGELEYYKKVIEVGSSLFAFGFPALILSYTKSKDSKQYFFLLGSIFVVVLTLLLWPVLGFFHLAFLTIPFVFYALFFNGGIMQSFLLVSKGSNYASYYKIIVSILFYAIIYVSIRYFEVSGMAYVVVNYILFPVSLLHLFVLFVKQKLLLYKIKRYWRLFKKLLLNSLTLVVSNFANLMFLYTDIFIIKYLAENANVVIADYSFALNIANALMLIPITLVQVDIEKLKTNFLYMYTLQKKISILLVIATGFLIIVFYILTGTLYQDFQNVTTLFFIILAAKIIQGLTPVRGTLLVIQKRFRLNLYLNIAALLFNIVLSYVLFQFYEIIGVAVASFISLLIRYFLIRFYVEKQMKTLKK